MKKLKINDIIDFKYKSAASKSNFISNLNSDSEENNNGSKGNYWTSSISALCNSYKFNDKSYIIKKKDQLEEKYEATKNDQTKLMYKRNIGILETCEDFDLEKCKPFGKIEFLKKNKAQSQLIIQDMEIKVSPSYIFSFRNGDKKEIGAIWFIAKIKGYKKDDLRLFCDILYRFLNAYFSEKYIISTKFCMVVDVLKGIKLNYIEFEEYGDTKELDEIIEEMKTLM